MWTFLGLWVLWLGCNDDYLLQEPGTDPDELGEGWCAVQKLVDEQCVVCHSAAGRLGDLDLETDAYGTLTTGRSGVTDAPFVVSGDADGSYLLLKLVGPLGAGEGGTMPPGAALEAATVQLVRDWVNEGADGECSVEDTDTTVARHHPANFALPAEHGQAAKFQDEVCVACHGEDLLGQGAAVSCDTCHPAGWRTDCTFCHGDPVDGTGAPPVHLSGVDDGAQASFVPHRSHTELTSIKAPIACTACHEQPSDVLSLGHLFLGDSTRGEAEVDFTGGLSNLATWDGNGTCSNLYCHGNRGRDNGTMEHTGQVSTCHDCHPDPSSGRTAWQNGFQGELHEEHLREGVVCFECHGQTTNAALRIVDPAVHVDGEVQVSLVASMSYAGERCTGACHGETHSNEAW
jgi:hypothetical protein